MTWNPWKLRKQLAEAQKQRNRDLSDILYYRARLRGVLKLTKNTRVHEYVGNSFMNMLYASEITTSAITVDKLDMGD